MRHRVSASLLRPSGHAAECKGHEDEENRDVLQETADAPTRGLRRQLRDGLIDGDLRRPNQHLNLSSAAKTNLTDFLSKGVSDANHD